MQVVGVEGLGGAGGAGDLGSPLVIHQERRHVAREPNRPPHLHHQFSELGVVWIFAQVDACV